MSRDIRVFQEIQKRKLVYTETDTSESRYLGTEITDRKLVYDQESRYLGTEITGNLQNTTSKFST